jgi:hypothetical protein
MATHFHFLTVDPGAGQLAASLFLQPLVRAVEMPCRNDSCPIRPSDVLLRTLTAYKTGQHTPHCGNLNACGVPSQAGWIAVFEDGTFGRYRHRVRKHGKRGRGSG